jgi:serine/threonine protein kinase/tetratricopeptide (TPR) repeat protein
MADSGSDREPLEELAESFLARFRAGERPSLTDFIAAHPELADRIRKLFPALVEMEQAGSAIGPATGSIIPRAGDGRFRESMGDYQIIREVGRGGMGVVYEAIQESLGRHVALKVFAPWARADPRQIERFRREARAAARLHHTNIVPVFGVGECNGQRYYAMQFIQGQGLDAIIHELRRLRSAPDPEGESTVPPDSTRSALLAATVAHSLLTARFATTQEGEAAVAVANLSETGYEVSTPPMAMPAGAEPASDVSHSQWASQAGGSYARTIARVGLQVAEALAHAHGQGILHRDIKPSNLLLDIGGNVWVTDFGLAKADDADALTEAGDILGTIRYMAPERFRGDSGPQSDIYGLGVTLYEILTLRPAYDEGDRARLIDHILQTDPPPPRAVDPKIPRDLETIVLKAMAKHPDDRYTSASALAEDLRLFLEDRTILARRSSTSEQFWRWCKRNPLVAALGVLAVALTTAVAIISTVAAIWLGQSRSAALKNLGRARDAEVLARAESERARRSAAESEAVRKFLENDLLAAARPEGQEGGLGKQATIRQAVDAALPRVTEAFKDEPLIEAAVRTSLGTTYRYLGEPAEAIRQHERAVALRDAQLGPDHADTLTSRNSLATAYGDGGRIVEAIAVHEATLKLRESKLGADHPDTLSSRNNLGVAYLDSGRIAEAIGLLEEAVKGRESTLGADHPDTLISRNNLGEAYSTAGRTAEAIAMHEATLKLRESKLGPDHPATLTSRNNLAIAYRAAGRTAEAIAIHEVTLKLRESKLGPDHPKTLASRINLASAYRAVGRTEKAIAMDEVTLKLSQLKLGPDHPITLSSRNSLAEGYKASGRIAEAIALHKSTLKQRESKLGADHPDTLVSRNNLALAYQAAGRVAEAIPVWEAMLPALRKQPQQWRGYTITAFDSLASAHESLGQWSGAEPLRREIVARRHETPDSPALAGDLAALGANLQQQDKWSEAERVLRECLAIRDKALPDDRPRFNVMSLLGGALLGQGKFAEAEPLLLQGYQQMKTREPKIPQDGRRLTLEAAKRVVRLYEAWGKPDQAKGWALRLGLADLPAEVFNGP